VNVRETRKLLVVAVLTGAASAVQAGIIYQTGFGAPDFTSGPVTGQDGWTGDGAIQAGIVISGSQAMEAFADGGSFDIIAIDNATFPSAIEAIAFASLTDATSFVGNLTISQVPEPAALPLAVKPCRSGEQFAGVLPRLRSDGVPGSSLLPPSAPGRAWTIARGQAVTRIARADSGAALPGGPISRKRRRAGFHADNWRALPRWSVEASG